MIAYFYSYKTGVWRWYELESIYARSAQRHGAGGSLADAIDAARGQIYVPRKPDVQPETNRIERSTT